ncbi:hypothetical protein MKW98_025694 [Papaver atlanticum]|uniref:Uncharacterized protein n=1 Tax=Papaver atlanticum TaxID=357466 RepID=A0AAD4XC06_9MAGN|nr:hypothetical protein MKW98_025694 [Papaver atlanticum]
MVIGEEDGPQLILVTKFHGFIFFFDGVLRLWLERKIFLESILQHYVEDFGFYNDEILEFLIDICLEQSLV